MDKYLKDESGAIVRDAEGNPKLKEVKFAPAYGEAKAKQDKIDREGRERIKQFIADAEERDRVAEAKKKPFISKRDFPLIFNENGDLREFWVAIIVILFFLFFGIDTDYKYR